MEEEVFFLEISGLHGGECGCASMRHRVDCFFAEGAGSTFLRNVVKFVLGYVPLYKKRDTFTFAVFDKSIY
jgi:hypothetical protein